MLSYKIGAHLWHMLSTLTTTSTTYDTDEEALRTVHPMEGTGWGTGQLTFRIYHGVQLKGARGSQVYEGRLYPGAITDDVACMIHEYGTAAADMIIERNCAQIIGESNYQDWALPMIKNLEDGRFIPDGFKTRAAACPRR